MNEIKIKKKRILKLEISIFKSLLIIFFEFIMSEFNNFYIQKIMSWKRWKIFFSFCWFV